MRPLEIAAACALAVLSSIGVPTDLRGEEPEARLIVRVRDEAGAPLELSGARVLIAAWGEYCSADLPVRGSEVELPLDARWLSRVWPARGLAAMEGYLFLESPGRATLRSERFLWLGCHRRRGGRPEASTVEVSFPSGETALVGQGEESEIEVILRRLEERRLLIVGEDGAPIPGVGVVASVFHTHENHCGVTLGEFLASAVSSDDGRIRLPGGDFEYALSFVAGDYVLSNPPLYWKPREHIGYLKDAETTMVLHEILRRPLSIRVTRNGMPAAGVSVLLKAVEHGCGTCSGIVGATDANGLLEIEYAPETTEAFFIEDEMGRRIWEADPPGWEALEEIHADLREKSPAGHGQRAD